MSTAAGGPATTLSDATRRTFARLAGVSALIAASVASLVLGIFIGSAARKRIDRWSHGIS